MLVMSSSNHTETEALRPEELPKRDRVSTGAKFVYGLGELGPALAGNVLIFFFLIFMTNVAGLPASMAGYIFLIAKLWDAINDPLIGILSDRTRNRWGRRVPWMLYAGVPMAVFFFLQWVVPTFSDHPDTQRWALFSYYVVIAIALQATYTAVSLPHGALTPELSRDYDERTRINSFRFAFSIGGSIACLVIGLGVFYMQENVKPSWLETPQQAFLWMGGISAMVTLIAVYTSALGIRRIAAMRDRRRRRQEGYYTRADFQTQLKAVITNRAYLCVIGIYLFSWLGVQITATILPYYVVSWMGLEMTHFFIVTLVVQGTALLMIFAWSRLSQRFGKKEVYFVGMIIWILAQGGLFFLQPHQTTLMYLLAVMAGFGVSTAYLIPWSMMPDVMEKDELETGQRREGIFYGFVVFLQKLGLALGIFIVSQLLAIFGFQEAGPGQPPPDQPDSALMAIRIAVGPLPTLMLLIGMFLAWLYPITRAKHAELRAAIREKRLQSRRNA